MSGRIGYVSPFVPPEWVAAHGLVPLRMEPGGSGGPSPAAGVCPYAFEFAEAACGLDGDDGVVVAATCDQMRRCAETIAGPRMFVMHVPAAWEAPEAREYYAEELRRLGRFMVGLGGKTPDGEQLRATMIEFELRRGCERAVEEGGIAVALVGGPMRRADEWVLGAIREVGGTVALDATEHGERTRPGNFAWKDPRTDPFETLVRAYFDVIPDVFRRPDRLLEEYLSREVRRRGIRGVIVVRCVWCDLWHAKVQRLRELLGLPLVEIDVGGAEEMMSRLRTRIESLMEMLR